MPWASSITPLPISTPETNVTGGPLPYQVLLDKVGYLNDESKANGYAYISTDGLTQTIGIIVVDSNNTIMDVTSVPLSTSTNRFSFQLDLSHLPVGNYSVQVSTFHKGIWWMLGSTSGALNRTGHSNA